MTVGDVAGDKQYFAGMIDEVRARLARLAQAARTVTKIPKQVLSRCEWGHDDYSLQVENLPSKSTEPGQRALFGDGERQ